MGRAFYVTDFRSALDEKATPIPPELATSVGILSDKENLYFIIEAKEPNTAELKADGTDFSGIWGDDMVEIFLAPQNNAQKYYQFAVNTKGTVVELEQPGNNKEVSFGASAKATVRADGYTIELKIPTMKLEGVFAPGASWKVHAARNRKVRDALPATGWSIDGAGYHALLDYRTMNIGDPLLRNGSFEEGTQENGSPKSWGRNGKNQGELVALPNGGHAFKLVPGGDLRQIPYGKLFRRKKPIKIEVSSCFGQWRLYVSNARFNQTDTIRANRQQIHRHRKCGQIHLVPEKWCISCEYTILADEFTSLSRVHARIHHAAR